MPRPCIGPRRVRQTLAASAVAPPLTVRARSSLRKLRTVLGILHHPAELRDFIAQPIALRPNLRRARLLSLFDEREHFIGNRPQFRLEREDVIDARPVSEDVLRLGGKKLPGVHRTIAV